MVSKSIKQDELVKLFRNTFQEAEVKVLIFLATKYGCDKLCKNLRKSGWPALAIHGDKTQRERDWVMEQFRSGANPILIATDLASRGIHVDDVNFVVNFDFPNSIEDYIHRIGRTGRAGKTGTAISFFDSVQDSSLGPPLVDFLEKSNQTIPHDLKKYAPKRSSSHRTSSSSSYSRPSSYSLTKRHKYHPYR